MNNVIEHSESICNKLSFIGHFIRILVSPMYRYIHLMLFGFSKTIGLNGLGVNCHALAAVVFF